MQILYCNIYYDPTLQVVGVKYTETEKEVPPNCIYLQDAGCAQEAERLLREERAYLIEEGERLFNEIQADAEESQNTSTQHPQLDLPTNKRGRSELMDVLQLQGRARREASEQNGSCYPKSDEETR